MNWYIDYDGEVYSSATLNRYDADMMTNIGNYFETREEADEAVEKLKAWKRLKDKGFRFKGLATTILDMDCIEFDIDDIDGMSFRNSKTHKDLDLLFGGEE